MLLYTLRSDLKDAQLARDEIKVSTLRLLVSEVHNAEINKGDKLSDPEIIGIIQKELKKRKEAAVSFRQGSREELATKEEQEAEVLQQYLPSQISDEQLTEVIAEVINKVGAKNIVDMGKVMSEVLAKVAGQADGARVSTLVKEKLQNG